MNYVVNLKLTLVYSFCGPCRVATQCHFEFCMHSTTELSKQTIRLYHCCDCHDAMKQKLENAEPQLGHSKMRKHRYITHIHRIDAMY